VDKGRITADEADARLTRFTGATTYEALAPADLVIEAVFEDMAVKTSVLQAVEAVVRPDAILASNTSTLDLDRIAQAVADPSRVVGLHFFSPANIMRLLEVVRGAKTAPDVLATAMALGKRPGKVSVVSGVCDGFIGNRMFEEYLRQVWFLLEEGALPQQIDAALERWGFAMGPCRTMDLVGQDIGWAIRQRRVVEQPNRPYSGVIDRICEMGRFGQKTGKGIYLYADGRTPSPDPEIETLILAYSEEIGVTRRAISDEEIVERCCCPDQRGLADRG
jgi:3-hydroxyacyl-CoA dehydrogenase